ncbi:MAG: OmpA family protein [Chitinophagaceae bacterium]|nr:OmpA family protein [Chitinophagaceae bacterium]
MKFFILSSIFFLSFFAKSQSISFFENIESLPVNSKYNEETPIIHPSQKELYITRIKHSENVGGVADEGDIWVSTMHNNRISSPTRIPLNDRHSARLLGFTKQDEMFLAINFVDAQSRKRSLIAISKQHKNQWQKPNPLHIPYFPIYSEHISGSITLDGYTLILAIESIPRQGAEDIYVCFRTSDTSFTELKNVGSTINTPLQEKTPYLFNDGKTLYFSTNGRNGKGSFDIFTSQRVDDTWKNWTEVISVSPPVNTNGTELGFFFIPETEYAYFSSTQNSIGYSDIKRIRIQQASPQNNTFADLDSAKIGQTITLNTILFQQGKEVLLESSIPELNNLLSFLNKNKDIHIFIAGHTDVLGDENHNMLLSQKRVDTIIKYLIQNGINKQRLEGKGFGNTRPLYSQEASEEKRAYNRRVEITLFNK